MAKELPQRSDPLPPLTLRSQPALQAPEPLTLERLPYLDFRWQSSAAAQPNGEKEPNEARHENRPRIR